MADGEARLPGESSLLPLTLQATKPCSSPRSSSTSLFFFFFVTMVRRRQTTRLARLIVCRLWHRGEDDDDRHVPSGCFFSSLSSARVARFLLDRRVRITKGIDFELFSS
nr:hypothetical protein Iba_chr03aCG7660 [Ipomoea batatas]